MTDLMWNFCPRKAQPQVRRFRITILRRFLFQNLMIAVGVTAQKIYARCRLPGKVCTIGILGSFGKNFTGEAGETLPAVSAVQTERWTMKIRFYALGDDIAKSGCPVENNRHASFRKLFGHISDNKAFLLFFNL